MKEAGRREDYRSARNNKEEENGEGKKIIRGLEGQKSQLQKDSLKTQSKCLHIQLFSLHTNLSIIGVGRSGGLPPNTLFGTEGRQSGRMIREIWDSLFF